MLAVMKLTLKWICGVFLAVLVLTAGVMMAVALLSFVGVG